MNENSVDIEAQMRHFFVPKPTFAQGWMDGNPKYYLVYLFAISVKQDTLIVEMCLSMVLDESCFR